MNSDFFYYSLSIYLSFFMNIEVSVFNRCLSVADKRYRFIGVVSVICGSKF